MSGYMTNFPFGINTLDNTLQEGEGNIICDNLTAENIITPGNIAGETLTLVPTITGNSILVQPAADSAGNQFCYVGNSAGTGSAGHSCGFKTGSYNGGEIGLISNGDDVIYNGLAINSVGIYLTDKNFSITGNNGSGTTYTTHLSIPNASTSGINLKGFTDASSASAGFVGEVITSQVIPDDGITLTTTTWTDLTSISLTAGDWDVSGMVGFTGDITGTLSQGAITTTAGNSNTGVIEAGNSAITPTVSNGSCDITVSIPTVRINVSSTTTVYLKSICIFTVGISNSYGTIIARRRR